MRTFTLATLLMALVAIGACNTPTGPTGMNDGSGSGGTGGVSGGAGGAGGTGGTGGSGGSGGSGGTGGAVTPSDTSTMTWSLSDGCNDGRGLGVRLFDKTNNLVWPNGSEIYVAEPGRTVEVNISCRTGAKVCFGAEPNPSSATYWGVSLTGDEPCDTCCVTCQAGRVARNLTCGS